MTLSTRTFSDLVRDQAAAVQGRAAGLVDFSVGSILRAFAEAVAMVALWLQGLIIALLATTRASTSKGADLDTWMADYGVARVGAIKADGDVTFSRFTATLEATISPGATVETADGSQSFVVLADAANAAWNATRGLYVLAPGITSLTVPVEAVIAGAAGNVAANTINTITGTMVGIDTVVNAATFFSGSDAETDVQFRVRFQLFIASLSKGVKSAIAYAIASLEQNLTFLLVEYENYDGTTNRGHFYVVVDDGTGTPTADTLTRVANAIDAVRPMGITFGVYPPVVVNVDVSLVINLKAGADANAVKAIVEAAVEAYVDGLGMGMSVRLTRLAQVAYDASVEVANVTAMRLNGQAVDVAIDARQVARVYNLTVGVQ